MPYFEETTFEQAAETALEKTGKTVNTEEWEDLVFEAMTGYRSALEETGNETVSFDRAISAAVQYLSD